MDPYDTYEPTEPSDNCSSVTKGGKPTQWLQNLIWI